MSPARRRRAVELVLEKKHAIEQITDLRNRMLRLLDELDTGWDSTVLRFEVRTHVAHLNAILRTTTGTYRTSKGSRK